MHAIEIFRANIFILSILTSKRIAQFSFNLLPIYPYRPFSTQDEACDVAQSAPHGADFHANEKMDLKELISVRIWHASSRLMTNSL